MKKNTLLTLSLIFLSGNFIYSQKNIDRIDNNNLLEQTITNSSVKSARIEPIFAELKSSEQNNTGIPGIYEGATNAADFDNDGDMDMMVAGKINTTTKHTALYVNNQGVFSKFNFDFVDVHLSSIDWGDYNGDGYLDLIITGLDKAGHKTVNIYKNTAGEGFTRLENIGIVGVSEGNALWGDIDNDGDLDVFICGQSLSSSISMVYKNIGNDKFIIKQNLFAGTDEGFSILADIDNDGDLDIFYSGKEGANSLYTNTYIFKNNNNGVFTKVLTDDFGWDGSVDLQDYDDDGDLDAIITGWDGYGRSLSIVYRNNGNFNFEKVDYSNLTGIDNGQAKWGDFNYDGLSDLLVCGRYVRYHNNVWTEFPFTAIYTYDSINNNFTNQYYEIDSLQYSSAQWLDINSDSTLSVFISGQNNKDSIISAFHHELWPLKNYPPSQIDSIAHIVKNDTVELSWNKSTDDNNQTLSYNIYIYDVTREQYLVSPMADTVSGLRKVSKLGNVNLNTTWSLHGLQSGFYYWGVQAVDKAYMGGKFSKAGVFFISEEFSDIGYNIKDRLLAGTLTNMEYSFNNTKWLACTNDTTFNVEYIPGILFIRDINDTNNFITDTLHRPQAPSVQINYLEEVINIADINIEYAFDSLFTESFVSETLNITVTPGDSMHFRYMATKDTLASYIYNIYLPTRPESPFFTYNIELDELNWASDTAFPNLSDYDYYLISNTGGIYWGEVYAKPFILMQATYLEYHMVDTGSIGMRIASNSESQRFSSEWRICKINDILTKSFQTVSDNIGLIIFPNPASTFIYFEAESKIEIVKIYSIIGELIYSNSIYSYKDQIDVSEISPGTYLLQIVLEDAIITKKIIIK